MGISAATLRRLASLSLAPEQMAGVLDIIADMAEADEERRANQRIRKARSRDRNVTITGQERDEAENGFPNKEIPPTPPKEINPSPKTKTRVRASRIPDDFEPDLEEAVSLGLGLDGAAAEAANFCDYWKAKPTDNTKLDWPATWRVWCRKAAKEPNGKLRSTGPPAKPMVRITTDDPRWPACDARWREERGKPMPHVAGEGGSGWSIPADWLESRRTA